MLFYTAEARRNVAEQTRKDYGVATSSAPTLRRRSPLASIIIAACRGVVGVPYIGMGFATLG